MSPCVVPHADREKGGDGEEGVRDKDREGEKGRERKRNMYLDFSVSSMK